MEANDFIEGERVPSSLHDSAAPSLQPGAGRPFALDLEAGPAVGQQHEAGGAGHKMGAGAADGVPRPGGKVCFKEARESLGAPDDRAEAAVAEQVVAHAVPPGQARLPCEIRFGIQYIDRLGVGRILKGEGAAGQGFVQKPGAPRRAPVGAARTKASISACGTASKTRFRIRRSRSSWRRAKVR